jgi:single-stranded-DNA-specific exonuclease
LNDINSPVDTVLLNRGFQYDKIDDYLNLTKKHLLSYELLDNIKVAVECLLKHIEKDNNIHIIVDSDADGVTSAAILYQYLKRLSPNIKLTYSLHDGKEHGLSKDVLVPTNANLIIVPDAGTNDVKQCEFFSKQNIDVIILDHHESEKENPFAIIVNNQMSKNYSNKNLSGVGIVYKFLQALDEETWNNFADEYLDLVAMGNIADTMDLRSFETRAIVDLGLKQINNKFFQNLIKEQAYSIGENFNIISVAFYICPLINAMIRFGTQEQKQHMFRALIQDETEEFSYTSPKTKITKIESIYSKATRDCVNVRAKQNKAKEKSTEIITELIESENLTVNKVLIIDATKVLDKRLSGLVAMNLSEKYKRPCLLYRFNEKKKTCSGSARNYDNFEIKDLKKLLSSLDLFIFVAGHPNAFGHSFKKEDEEKIILELNERLKDIEISDYFEVDFVKDINDLSEFVFFDLDKVKDLWCNGINEPLFAIENVELYISDIKLLGTKNNNIKFKSNDIDFIKFRANEDDDIMQIVDGWGSKPNKITLNVIGRLSINTYGRNQSPQVMIESYEITSKN